MTIFLPNPKSQKILKSQPLPKRNALQNKMVPHITIVQQKIGSYLQSIPVSLSKGIKQIKINAVLVIRNNKHQE